MPEGYDILVFSDEEACQFDSDLVTKEGNNLVGGKRLAGIPQIAERPYPESRE